MSETNNLTVMQCPKCGAPIEMTADEVICSYCGTRLERPRPVPVPERIIQTVVVQQPSVARPVYVAPAARSSGAGCSILPVFMLFSVAAIIYLLVLRPAGIGDDLLRSLGISPNIAGPSLYLNGAMTLLPRQDDSPPDLLVIGLDRSANSTVAAAIDGKTHAVRWESQPLSKDSANRIALVAGKGLVYVTDQSSLLALNAGDGKLAWQVSMANGLPSNCPLSCIRLYGSRLVALTRDGTLQSFDAQTGVTSWSQRLQSTPGSIQDLNGKVLVVDKLSDQDQYDAAVLVIDPVTGHTDQKITPSCNVDGSLRKLGAGDTPIVTADGKGIIFEFSIESSCLQRWESGAKMPTWTTVVTSTNPTGIQLSYPGQKTALVSAQALYFTPAFPWKGWIEIVDPKTGQSRQFAEDNKYTLTIVGAQPGVLVVSAVPDYDSETTEVWGLDTSTGKRLWQNVLKVKGILAAWHAEITPAGLTLLQCVKDQPQCTFEILDPKTGVSSGQTAIAKSKSFSSVNNTLVNNQTELFNLNGILYAMDLAKRSVAYQWP